MAHEQDNEVEALKVRISQQAEAIRKLEARATDIEKAYIQLNKTYNDHIAGLHVKRLG